MITSGRSWSSGPRALPFLFATARRGGCPTRLARYRMKNAMAADSSKGDAPWPTELRLNPAHDRLTVAFDNGARFELAAEYLRVESPSAEVRGHGAGPKTI